LRRSNNSGNRASAPLVSVSSYEDQLTQPLGSSRMSLIRLSALRSMTRSTVAKLTVSPPAGLTSDPSHNWLICVQWLAQPNRRSSRSRIGDLRFRSQRGLAKPPHSVTVVLRKERCR
jgi:hypothetical protein